MLYLGGALGGTRFLGRKTLEFMTADHLGPDVRIGNPTLLHPGYGFGLGFAVRREVGMAATPGIPGEFYWGGLAGTVFWIAPQGRAGRDDDDPGAGTAGLLSPPVPHSCPCRARLALHPSKARAPSQISRSTWAAGSARASRADCPAQTCMRLTSPTFCASVRMVAVNTRCTGYGAGGGASGAVAARTYSVAMLARRGR